ncbi:hypothetical protein PCANC_21115 [Puccinia coronata f. sp. avenae]|uniref:DUF3533 domain-containing protein n=2 Tax=Puccinia coronata f. sp. avenae TaxID=200324 RepID=A0A2N5TW30_9BASI|nr:hypothetical protein PCANC_27127 [Puccinia coronata f. sp. avenae]PLW29684.1 hypothetical protein PCANC_21115 [Puccinia coronata f. sp. avenae]
MACKDSPPSDFSPLSDCVIEEASTRDSISNHDGFLDEKAPNTSQPSKDLTMDRYLETPTIVIPDPTFRCDFFASELQSERRAYIRAVALSTLGTALVIISVLSIYWGTLWKLDERAYKLRGVVVDFDQGDVGQAVQRASQGLTGSSRQITWTVENPSAFKDPSSVAQLVLDERYWVAIVVQPGCTDNLRKAISSVDSNYNGTAAVSVYISQGRQEQAYSLFLSPQLREVLQAAQLSFRNQNAQSLSHSNFNLTNVMQNAPQTILDPFDFQVIDLRPFDVPVTTALTAIGLIYVAFAALVACTHSLQARKQLGLNDKLTLTSLLKVRICSPLIAYFWLSFSYALLSVFFHVPFGRFRGAGGFPLCWIMFFLGMSALGLTIEVVTVILTPQYVSYFMIFWIIWNISVCYLPIDVLPSIYAYAHMAPFYNIGRAARNIILDGKNERKFCLI